MPSLTASSRSSLMFSSVKPGKRLAVVELQLLHQRQAGVLGLFQPSQHGPHGGHFDRVRGDVLAAHLALVVVLLVDANLVGQSRDVGNVDLDRAIAQGFHELVVLQTPILRLVRVPQNHFVNVGLRKLLRLHLVLLAGTEQIVQERHVQLEHFDEFQDATIGNVEFTVEVEGARIAVAAVLGNLAVVDVAGQFGRVLVLFVLRLERADAHAILLAQQDPPDPHVLRHLRPVAAVLLQPLREHKAAERTEVVLDLHAVVVRRIAR